MAILFARETSAGAPLNFSFVRGARWDDDFQLVDQVTGDPIDLTGITRILMRVRTRINASTVLFELSNEVGNGRLVITNAATGSVGIRVNSADSNTFPANGHRKAKYVYDAVIERTVGEYEPAIGGKVAVLPQTSRPLDDAP